METVLASVCRQVSLPVREASEIAAARRAANELAKDHGLDETACGRVALVVMEAATNIVKHAGQGEMLLRRVTAGGVPGVEVIALDAGPGMADLAGSARDGTSTAGSYGVGLGAMQRVADEIDIYTYPGKGTAIWMTVWQRTPPPASWQIGAACVALPGETACGDSWGVCTEPGSFVVLVADGLGHGPVAAEAAEAATAALVARPALPPGALMQDVQAALRSTRGAAVAIAAIDATTETGRFAGIGNIAASVIEDGQRRQLVSHNGIVGSNMRKVQEMPLAWSERALLLLHSDGLGTRWSLDAYPGLESCHAGLIAAVLYRDFARRRDDVTVLVVRAQQGGAS
ncbi:serine/threonine protein kinase [Oxalobacteraceae bacterium OM1]|nr:serine/threonine protein kinase [Oxalobacteraceae bacterium OM1]